MNVDMQNIMMRIVIAPQSVLAWYSGDILKCCTLPCQMSTSMRDVVVIPIIPTRMNRMRKAFIVLYIWLKNTLLIPSSEIHLLKINIGGRRQMVFFMGYHFHISSPTFCFRKILKNIKNIKIINYIYMLKKC